MLLRNLRDMIGRRVRIVSREHAEFIGSFIEQSHLGKEIQGVIKHIDPYGDAWVRVDGLDRNYAFGIGHLELIP